jgi:transposase
VSAPECACCDHCRAALAEARRRVDELTAELAAVRAQLREVVKHDELQGQDLARLRDEHERTRPNCPERVLGAEAQLAFEEVLAAFPDSAPANDQAEEASAPPRPDDKPPPPRRRHPHGRRRLDLTNLPVEIVPIDPPEVEAAAREGFERIGEETSERLAFRPAQYFRLRIVRTKWRAVAAPVGGVGEAGPVLVAPLPESVWPAVMADPSAVAHGILSKYDDILPLYRQERISARHGFMIPRSTQCGWFTCAYEILYRIVEAMLAEARRAAFCIATDATGGPVRAAGGAELWHVFVLIADRDHVIFRHSREHSGEAVRAMLDGFHGHLLSDAASIYDVLHREEGMTEVACWFHCRRYFWRALETERELALQALAIIARLFAIERACRDLDPAERAARRDRESRPVLALLDAWIDRHRAQAEPRGRLARAIGYYDNQRIALHRFLDDGRLALDNGGSERALRNLALGRHNWGPFANETGLAWYTVFRSLIASCALHDLNAQEYLEDVLRLAPHWPVTRMLELCPKYWARTLAGLDARHRAILRRPWERAAVAAPPPAEITPAA